MNRIIIPAKTIVVIGYSPNTLQCTRAGPFEHPSWLYTACCEAWRDAQLLCYSE